MWSGKRGRGQRSRPRHRRVKFDYFSLPVALDKAFHVSALQRPWAWLEQEEHEHLLQGNCFNPPSGPEYTGAEFREGFPPACHQPFRTTRRILAP
jgi:hypothetical protein